MLRTGAITFLALAAVLVGVGCGSSPSMSQDEYLRRISDAIQSPVSSPEASAEHSRLVEAALEDRALDDMTRAEVQAAIGRGDPCSRHPRCAEQAFEPDDWFYTVGQMGDGSAGVVPILIVGFDHTGRVVRTWNLSTHED